MSIRKANKCAKPSEASIDKSVRSLCADVDAPLTNPDHDLLGRAILAKRIAEGIASGDNESSSLVIGIEGMWGSGKTTVLHFVEEYLKRGYENEVVLLDFDPWLVSGEEELLVAFMTSLAHAVSSSIVSKKQKAAKVGKAILEYVSLALKFASVVPVFKVADSLADASDSLKDKLEKLSQSSLADMKEKISQELQTFGKRIVVFMDDLDRLDKSELYFIMKLVKLVADFPLVTYVLAFDDHMVARSIGEMYTKAADEQDAEKAGKDYLEKIVQVPIRLSIPTEPALRSIALKAISESVDRHDKMFEKNDGEVQRFVSDFDAGILPFIRTPRRAKQIGTRVEWALSMMAHEINTTDLILLEALAVCQPEAYQCILDRPDLFCGEPGESSNPTEIDRIKVKTKAEIDSRLWIESDGERSGGWFLLHDIFPHTRWLTSNTTYYGSSEDSTWERDQRVASEQYLKRYIHMTIPETDVSDVAVRNAIEELPRLDAAQGKALLGSILTGQNAQMLVFKLRRQAGKLSASSAGALAHVVALLGDRMPQREGPLSFFSAAQEGPILVRDLLERIDDMSERRNVAAQVLQESTGVQFAISVYWWVCYRLPSQNSHTGLFSNAESASLADVVLERIRGMASTNEPLYVQEPGDAKDILLFWGRLGPEREAKDYVTNTVQTDAANAMVLLNVFRPFSQTSENGQTFRGSLAADTFLSLGRIVDVRVMRSALEQVFGETLSADEYPFIPGSVDDKQLVAQFVYFCEHPPKQQSDATP